MIIIICITCLIIIFFVINIIYIKKNFTRINKLRYDDYLCHITSNKGTPIRVLSNILAYNKHVSFISINTLSENVSYDNGIEGADNIIDILKLPNKKVFNEKNHYLQGFTELKEGNMYMGHKYSHPLEEPIKLVQYLDDYEVLRLYLMKFKRLSDNKEFYYIQLNMEKTVLIKYENFKYLYLYNILEYIKKNYPGDYIITGFVNLDHHENIFNICLGSDKYHICPVSDYFTTIRDNGLFSVDCMIISKNLYREVEFNIDFYPGYSYQNLMVTAKLYINGPIKTTPILSTQMLDYITNIKKYIERYKPRKLVDKTYILKHMPTLKLKIVKEKLHKSNIITYTNQNLTALLGKIK
jgi:hypothetical protein